MVGPKRVLRHRLGSQPSCCAVYTAPGRPCLCAFARTAFEITARAAKKERTRKSVFGQTTHVPGFGWGKASSLMAGSAAAGGPCTVTANAEGAQPPCPKSAYIVPQQSQEGGTDIMTPVSWLRKLRHREFQQQAPSHRVAKLGFEPPFSNSFLAEEQSSQCTQSPGHR